MSDIIVHKAIEGHDMETMAYFEPKHKCQYQLASFVRNWPKTVWKGVAILRKYSYIW